MHATDVILFLCHRWNRTSRRHLAHLRATKPTAFDLRVLSDARSVGAPPVHTPVDAFSVEDLRARGYAFLAGDVVPGSAHVAVLEFARRHPGYRHLWVVEYDVAFTGRWDAILAALAPYDADLVAPHVRRHADEPGWEWWATLEGTAASAEKGSWIRAFLPFYRLSHRAALLLRTANLAGRVAHFEALVPTLLSEAGLPVLDCGGDGPFTPEALRGRFYTTTSTSSGELSGTIRYRPLYRRPGREPGRLYHPVKQLTLRERFGPAALRGRLENLRRASRRREEGPLGRRTGELPSRGSSPRLQPPNEPHERSEAGGDDHAGAAPSPRPGLRFPPR